MDKTISGREPSLVLPLLLFVLPLFFSDAVFKSSIMQFASIALGVLLLFVFAYKLNWRLNMTMPFVLWAAFVLLALTNNNQVFNTGLGRSWFYLFPMALIAAFLLSSAPGARWKETLITIVVMCAAVHALVTVISFLVPSFYAYAIRQTLFGSVATIMGEGYQAGLTTHYSTNGTYLAIGFIVSSIRWLNNRSGKNLVITLLLLFALILTAKRAHCIFSIVAIAVTYLWLNKKHAFQMSFKVIAVLCALLISVWVLSFVSEDISLLLDRFALIADDDTMNGRTDFYDLCLIMFSDNPLLGNGWGSYTMNFNLTPLGAWYSSLGYTGMFAHNVFLQILAEEGIVGELLFILAIASSLFRTAGVINRLGATDNKIAYPLTSLAIQLFFILYCITGNPLYDMQVFFPYMLFTSLAISEMSVKRDCRSPIQLKLSESA